MNDIIRLSRKIKNKYDTVYQITKANEGHPDYLKNYRDADRRNRRLAQVTEELKALKAERTALGYQTIQQLRVSKTARTKVKGKPNKNPNRYMDSFGNTWTQKEIDRKRGEAYKEKYKDNPNPACQGLGIVRAECTAHIIPQARCKQLHKTELIWDLDNMFPATFAANLAIENPKGAAWKSLKNVEKCLAYMKENDLELYAKFMNY